MDVKHDRKAKACYIRLTNNKVSSQQIAGADERVIVDLDHHDNVVGIEVLNVSSMTVKNEEDTDGT